MIAVPTLTSERLVLEPLSLDHSAGMFRLWRAPEVCRFSGPAADCEGRPIALPAQSPADSDKIIAFFARRQLAGQGFRWALTTRADGRFVGTVGFNSLGPCSEYACHLHPDAWGRGLMAEASRVALRWLQQQDGLGEAEAFIDPDNGRSIQLCERLGFRATGQSVNGAARYVLVPTMG